MEGPEGGRLLHSFHACGFLSREALAKANVKGSKKLKWHLLNFLLPGLFGKEVFQLESAIGMISQSPLS